MAHPVVNFTLSDQFCTLSPMNIGNCIITEPVAIALRTMSTHHATPQDFSLRVWVSEVNSSQSVGVGSLVPHYHLTHLADLNMNIRTDDQPSRDGAIDIAIDQGKVYTLHVQNLVNSVATFSIRKL